VNASEITGLGCFQMYLASQDFEEVLNPEAFLGPGEFVRKQTRDGGTGIFLGSVDVGDPSAVIEFRFDSDGRLIGYGVHV
jgi:hypothetical protein